MFDIGFWEITVIAVIALLVVGPEEFPTLIKTTRSMLRKMRQYLSEIKTDLDDEMHKMEELKERITKETEIAAAHAHQVIDETKATIPVGINPAAVSNAGQIRNEKHGLESRDKQSDGTSK